MSEIITIAEAAKRTGKTHAHIFSVVRSGKVKKHILNRPVVGVDIDELAAFFADQKRGRPRKEALNEQD